MQFAEKIVDRALRKTGSTWITQEDLEKEMARSNTGTMNDIIYGVKDKFLVSFKMGNGMTAYSTKHFHNAENTIAENVMRLQFVIPSAKYDEAVIDQLIDEFEEQKNNGRKLHYHQRDAVKMVCNNNFSVLTGGPGTGKTTVLSAITYCLRALDQRLRLFLRHLLERLPDVLPKAQENTLLLCIKNLVSDIIRIFHLFFMKTLCL